ncbi:hypothetical protein ACFFWC_24685 [Plantactinospora siamensis]|uniref:Uncharacterized protein n=1 Tax=Plantactinospora siamensis TaxID=555372 RepID=A0ABV6P807_9ACTN
MDERTGWCPPGGCRARLDRELELAVALAFEQGRAYERAELAQLESTWPALARKTWEESVAERVAQLAGSTPPPRLRFNDPDWPPVAVPGGGGIRIGPGRGAHEGVAA